METTLASAATGALASSATRRKTRVRVIAGASADLEVDALDDVPQIAGRIPKRRHALGLADTVQRADHDRLRPPSGRRTPRRPLAERIAAEVRPEGRRAPGLPAVVGDLDGLDAIAAVERDPGERRRRADGNAGATLRRRDEGPRPHPADRHGAGGRGAGLDAAARRVRNPVGGLHPELLER